MTNTNTVVTGRDAAGMAGVSESAWYRLVKARLAPQPIRLGRRVVWHRETLEKWLADQSEAAQAGALCGAE